MKPRIVRLSDSVTIIHGDCREVMPTLKGIDAIVSDPPYGIGLHHGGGGQGLTVHRRNSRRYKMSWDSEKYDPSHLLPFAKVVLFGADHFAHLLPHGEGDWIAWDKCCGMGSNSTFRDTEFIWSRTRTARNIFHHLWLGALRAGEDASSRNARRHVSQKPVELMLWLIGQARIGLGKTILDPYMGSGTTGIACLRTGRKFIGIELDRKYFEIARKRLQKEIACQAMASA